VVLTSKLIDGTFPDYQRVIPTGNDKDMTVDCQTFAQAVDRVSTISSERGRAVKLALADGQMTLTVNNPDSGRRRRSSQSTIRDPIEIGFNATLPARHHQPAFGFGRGVHAGRSGLADTGARHRRRDSLYVLMPMRV
jgi:DNA polymerase-3 subunit beta